MSHVTNASEQLMSQSAGTSSVLATDSQFEIKRYKTTGIHTVEGNVAGPRAARLTKQRESEQREHDRKRKAIESQHRGDKVMRVDDKFNAQMDNTSSKFIERTTGLVSAADFKKINQELMEGESEDVKQARLERKERKRQRKKLENKKKKDKARAQLSFGEDLVEVFDEDQAEEPVVEKVMKNPTVETSFLPDREREMKIVEQRQKLAEEWGEQQEKVKKELLEVTYSYWDGSGHRRDITVDKGYTIGKFLESVRLELLKEFPELRSTSADSLLYVKEDLIIPHNFSFYDLIVTKARGKSGPLFHFDVHDDIRILGDATVEKDESHPGKVVERRWYDRNKHIFPASRWEIYDPSVTFDKYTIHGGEIMTKK